MVLIRYERSQKDLLSHMHDTYKALKHVLRILCSSTGGFYQVWTGATVDSVLKKSFSNALLVTKRGFRK